MTTQMNFPKAPITEAILDIRVELPKETDISKLALYENLVKKEFPIKEVKVEFQASFQFKEGKPQVSSVPAQESGYLFFTAEKNKIAQSRLDGFTFNLLKPYSKWEEFSSEGNELWQKYKEIAKPIKIVRTALRYINKIEIPLPVDKLEDYLKTRPVICPDIKTNLENFLLKINLSPTVDNPNNAIILVTIDQSNQNNKILPLIIDIDVFRAIDLDIKDDKQLWKIFEELRNFKNELFINSITEKTQDLFK